MLRCANMNLYLHSRWVFQVLTSERCGTVSTSFRYHEYSIRIKKPSEPVSAFQICFSVFISFNVQRGEFFNENVQNESNGGCFEHESIFA